MEFLLNDGDENPPGNHVISRGLRGEVQKSVSSPAEGTRTIGSLRPRTPLLDTEREIAVFDSGNTGKDSSCEKFSIKRASNHFDDDDDSPSFDSCRQKVEYSREGFDFTIDDCNNTPHVDNVENIGKGEDDFAANDVSMRQSSVDASIDDQKEAAIHDSVNEVQSETGSGEDDVDQDHHQAGVERAETDEERIARELAESEALAWQMMQQEADNAYHMQLEYMRNNQDNMSAEDYAALTQIVQEGAVQQVGSPLRDEEDGTEEHEEDDSADSSAAWEDPNNYDRLLALGSHIGDVKTERWRLRCQEVIAKQPRVKFCDILALIKHRHYFCADSNSDPDSAATSQESVSSTGSLENSAVGVFTVASIHEASESQAVKEVEGTQLMRVLREDSNNKRLQSFCERVPDMRCAVCMGSFDTDSHSKSSDQDLERSGDEETLILLPCNHYFHEQCCIGWMNDNNSCPMCKVEVERA